MKAFIVICTLCCLSFAGRAQTINCTKFKTGKFSYANIAGKTSLRKDSIQENYNHGRLESVWKVKWSGNCTYELTCKQVVQQSGIKVGDRMVCTITRVNGNCYTASVMLYNDEYPNGAIIAAGQTCISKN